MTPVFAEGFPEELAKAGLVDYELWSSGESAVVIVARLGQARDWAAYIAGVFCNWPLESCLRYALFNGCKLTPEQAAALLPGMARRAARDGLTYRL